MKIFPLQSNMRYPDSRCTGMTILIHIFAGVTRHSDDDYGFNEQRGPEIVLRPPSNQGLYEFMVCIPDNLRLLLRSFSFYMCPRDKFC